MNLSAIFLKAPKVRYGVKESPEVKFFDMTKKEDDFTPKESKPEQVIQLDLFTFDEPNKNATVFTKKASVEITQETRDEAHAHIQETLGERQRLVLRKLQEVFSDGATAKELSNHLHLMGFTASPERNSVHPRLNELVERGLVEVIGKKTCVYTNRKVAIYKSKI